MNLQDTIDELERQAAQFTEAANTLRGLQQQDGAGSAASRSGAPSGVGARKAAAKKSAAKSGRGAKRGRRKGPVSEETRLKISEALRASHAKRKAKSGR